jgi:metallo-beta-lactamase family protein
LPPGGRGAWIKSGAPSLTLFGEEVPIRAVIEEISGLSAHADQAELLRWCREGLALSNNGKPTKVAVVHGEPESAQSFTSRLREEFQWNAWMPKYREHYEF